MSEHVFQIYLVVTGALIGLVSSLTAVWLTALQAKVRHRKNELARIHELIGERCALRSSDPLEEEDLLSKWLKTKNATRLDRIAFMTGFLKKNNMQLREALEMESRAQARVSEAKAAEAKVQREMDGLVRERDRLIRESDALESTNAALELKKKALEARKKSEQNK